MTQATANFPTETRVVIIGGGIMGCSVAYHLAKFGVPDVVLVERKQLTSGTTWHSAAQVRQLRSSANLTRIIKNSVALYSSLEAETGQATGWRQTGSLSIATSDDRLTHIKRQAALANLFDVPAEVVDRDMAAALWPLMNADDIIGAVHAPTDGRVNPSDTCAALIKGAKAGGVQVFEDTAVTGFEKTGDRISAVVTERGRIACQTVVLTAGLWSREVARLADVNAPLYACEHFYLLTKPIAEVTAHLPTLSDHDGHLYIRDDVEGLLVGCFEPNAKPLPMDKLPKDFAFDLLNEDWDHFEPMMMNALHRLPCLETAEVRMLLNGPESFTSDGQFMLGESADLKGFFLGCGMNSMGVGSGGGAGRALAEWIVEGQPTMDLWPLDPRRFAPWQNVKAALHERIPEELGLHYAISYPGRQYASVRDLRLTPLHDSLKARGARFGQRVGWERAEYFVPAGQIIADTLSFARPPWFDIAAAEHRAARENVVITDQSSFAKLLLAGPDAASVLGRLCANDVDVEPGRVVYTPMLNTRGGIESDLTLLREAEDRYLIVTGTGQATKDADWIRRHMPEGAHAHLIDVTSGLAVIGVAGPNARSLMQLVSPDDLSNEGFRFYSHREIEIGYGKARAARLSYTGELGWELYVPTEVAAHVYGALLDAGADLGVMDLGLHAMSSLRIEKGFRAWGHDITAGDTPLEAGLGFTVKLDGNRDFIGRDALLKQRDAGLGRRLVFLTLDDPDAVPLGGEPILAAGTPVGQVTSATFGHTVGKPICIGYIDRTPAEIEAMAAMGVAIDIARRIFPAALSVNAPYDPKGERVRM